MNYTPAYIDKQLAAIERVRELHFALSDGFCFECEHTYYPCQTIKLLDGEWE